MKRSPRSENFYHYLREFEFTQLRAQPELRNDELLSRVRPVLQRERLLQDDTGTPEEVVVALVREVRGIDKAYPQLPTIWYHGERSYSLNDGVPVVVSHSEHDMLKAFLNKENALDTSQLEKTVGNPSRVCTQLAKRFHGAVRTPGKVKGAGYFIRVRSKAS